MRQMIYDRIHEIEKASCGYVETKTLLAGGITNRQIGQLLAEGYLEKIANGYFWLAGGGKRKPDAYKAVEACFVNPKAVICADSACYYHGLIHIEPERLSVATRRGDRRKMELPFAVSRHYFAENHFEEGLERAETAYGRYSVYNLERSVCDCIRFREEIEPRIFSLLIERYREGQDDSRVRRMLAYARVMKFEKRMKEVL